MTAYLYAAFVGLVLTCGCVVKEDYEDGIRELRPSMKAWSLSRTPNGSGDLEFTFHYELGIIDEAGIDEVTWIYQIHTVDQQILAEHSQQMREPELEKTEILVQGDRQRRLSVDAGLENNGVYVLHLYIYYRGELLKEYLTRVVAGDSFTAPSDAQ